MYLITGKTKFNISGHFPTVFQSGGTRSHCHQQHDISRCPHPCRHDASPGRCHSGGYEGCSDTASWAHLACFQWHVLRACLCAYQPSGCPSAMGLSTAFALVCFWIELSAFFLLIYKRSLYITAASPFQVRVVRLPSLTLGCLFTLLRVYWF